MSKKVDKYNLGDLISDRSNYKSYKGFNRETSDQVYIRMYPNQANLTESPEYHEMNISPIKSHRENVVNETREMSRKS